MSRSLGSATLLSVECRVASPFPASVALSPGPRLDCVLDLASVAPAALSPRPCTSLSTLPLPSVGAARERPAVGSPLAFPLNSSAAEFHSRCHLLCKLTGSRCAVATCTCRPHGLRAVGGPRCLHSEWRNGPPGDAVLRVGGMVAPSCPSRVHWCLTAAFLSVGVRSGDSSWGSPVSSCPGFGFSFLC